MKTQREFLKPYWSPHRHKLILAVLLACVSVLLDHASPWILKILIDGHEPGRAGSLPGFGLLALLVAAILVSGVLGYFQRQLVATFSRNVESEIREDLFRKILHQNHIDFSSHPISDILTNLVQDLEKIQEMVGPAILHFFRTGLTLVISTYMLYLLSPALSLLGFLFFVILAFASLRLMQLVYQGHRRTQKAQANLTGVLRDYLNGIQTAKASRASDYFVDMLSKASADLKNANQSIASLSATIWPSVTLLCGIGIAGSIVWGAGEVGYGNLGTGSLTAAVLYLVRAQFPLVGLGIMAAMVQRGRASLDRILKFDQELDCNYRSMKVQEQGAYREILVKDLTYRYEHSQKLALEGVDLHLAPGKCIGIAGPTGSGKSTLVKLLCGELIPGKDMIWINGRDIHELHAMNPQSNWRSLFGYAPQEGFLFSWTIAENISFGSPERMDQVQSSAETAGLIQDISPLPDGIGSQLGEKGINLSGGQRQRVGLARAIHAGSPVLLLDDVLSAVDLATESFIVESLRKNCSSQTMVIVSHRYSTLLHCDEILYLKEGRILERGTHAELLSLNGEYARSWKLQSEDPAS